MLQHEPTDQENVRRAFQLAYFIHADGRIAFRVTEAALSKLDHTFGRQGRRFHYVPGGRGQSGGSKANALRTKVSLRREHLLQLLVYAESDLWERYTEDGVDSDGLTNEDMVIRFIKHLVQITLKRNSFYVTLGIGRLLYEYDTSQVRQMYDILMQDHARFRDNSYLRKQKKLLMRELIERFGSMIRLMKTAQRESRFVTQPTSQSLIGLVYESLHRYTPWDTSCIVPDSFDPAERLPALAFVGTDPDKETPVEMNRIHTILDPDCFSRLILGLELESPDKRLAIPLFHFSNNKEPRGDRFNPPPLTAEDQAKLRRTRDESARRRKQYRAGLLRIYVDDVENVTFDPSCLARVMFKFRPGANVIEVRGTDSEGELPLATLLVSYEDIPLAASLEDSVLLESGQKITLVLTPVRNALGGTKELSAQIAYAETWPLRAIAWRVQQARARLFGTSKNHLQSSQEFKSAYSGWVKVALTGTTILIGSIVIASLWRQRQATQPKLPDPIRVQSTPVPTASATSVVPTSTPNESPTDRSPSSLVVRASWNKHSEGLSDAIRIDARRGSVASVDIAATKTTLLLALNRADADDRSYQRYRLVLSAATKPIWQSTIPAPRVIASSPAHLLKLELFPQRFPKDDSYELRVEGETRGSWQSVGKVILKVSSP